MKNFFYSLISFVIALFFIALGIVCVMIPWSGQIRYFLITLLLEDALALSIFGLAFIVIGAAIAAYIILNARRKSFTIQCGNQLALVDDAVVEQYLAVYWKQLFPDVEVSSRLSAHQGKIAISVDLPYIIMEEQLPLLKRIQGDLEFLLKSKIGYEDSFSLSASFANPPKISV